LFNPYSPIMQRFTLIILIVLLLTGCDFVRKINPFSKKADYQLELYQRQQDSIRLAEEYRLQQEEARRAQERAESIRQAELEAMMAAKVKPYHLVVGAFKTPAYAKSFHEKILAAGHESDIIMAENDFHLVTIKSTDDYRSAVNEWKAIRKGEYFDVWLYVQR
jgi:outer membrane murein-binding lipoprotein Lpp